MITRIEIREYRSCLNTAFDVQPQLSVLIGPNSSGKTNILTALLLLRKLAEENAGYHFPEEPPTAQCKLKVWFDIGGKRAILTTDIHTFTDENNKDIVVSSRQSWYVRDFTGNGKRVKLPLWISRHFTGKVPIHQDRFFIRRSHFFREERFPLDLPEAAIHALNVIAHYASEMRYYSASQFTNPSNCPVSFEIEKEGERSRGLRLHGHAKFLFDLYAEYKSKSAGYQQFFDIIGPGGIGLVDKVDFKEMLTSSIDYSVRIGGRAKQRKRDKILVIPQFTIGKHELSPNQLSEGTFKTITLLFYLVTEASSILLVEEPEVCVHHGLLSSIIELIKTYSREKQIIISTHSDFVLDQVLPENVYKVSSTPEQGTSIAHIPRSMSRNELVALREYLETEGNLGEYWRHGALES